MDSRLRCRSFRTYTGQRKPRCNRGKPCVACSLLHFYVYLSSDFEHGEVNADEAREVVENYIRSNPR